MFERLIGSLLNGALKPKTKRQMFLASLAALFKGSDTFDRETFEKLNKALALSESDENALGVPVVLSKAIWHGKTSVEIAGTDVMQGEISEARAQQIVNQVMSMVPSWLRYGKEGEMEKDLSTMLSERDQLLENH